MVRSTARCSAPGVFVDEMGTNTSFSSLHYSWALEGERVLCLVRRNRGPNTTAVIKGRLHKVRVLGLGRDRLRPWM